MLHVIARMNVGGPAVLISDLLSRSDDSAFEQQLVTGWCAPDEADLLLAQGSHPETIRIDGLGRAVKPWSDASALFELSSLIDRVRPDIVHTHTAKAGVIGRIAARRSRHRPKLVHTYHGHLLHGYFGRAKTQAVVAVERQLARKTDVLVTVGETVRDDLLQAGIGSASKYEVIYPGVELGTLPSKDEARRMLDVPSESFVVGYLGRLTKIKRPDRFVEIVHRLAPAFPNIEFVVAGSGDMADVVARAAKKLPIRMLGWRSDVETVLAASDALLLTSDNEGTPLSVLQALRAGLPVVASDVGCLPEIVRDGQTGLLAPPTAEDLSERLGQVLANSGLSEAMGRAGALDAQERFSIDTWVRGHEDLYVRMVR